MHADSDHDMRAAAVIQQLLLPAPRRRGSFFTAAGSSFPCRGIGGDFFDYVDPPSGEFGFIFGDVCGKGPAAALVAAAIVGMFSVEACYQPSAGAVLRRLNEGLLARGMTAQFATAFYALIDARGEFRYANGGHYAPLHFSADGATRLEASGTVLGLFHDAEFDDQRTTLVPGDLIVVFSDGITEAANEDGEEFEESRLLECVEAHRDDEPEAIIEAVVARVLSFCGEAPPLDDMAVVAMRYDGA
jgi:sigma-B regulation protein RsbU (phosphoserine phosphatase)